MSEQVTMSKELFSEVSELLGLADCITADILRLGLDKKPDNIANYALIFSDELSGNAWSDELVELLRKEEPESWKPQNECE